MKYYPRNKVRTGLYSSGEDLSLGDKPYVGYYYVTFKGEYYTGKSPLSKNSKKLKKVTRAVESLDLSRTDSVNKSEPTSYYPTPSESDYDKGYMLRCFVKKTYQKGFIKEISNEEYAAINNGTASYDISYYHTLQLFWKLTGPLKSKRIDQYNTRAGIIDTNRRLVENAEKQFFGIKAFIAEEYDKFSRPTE